MQQSGWEQQEIALAATHIISRAVYPASELKTVSNIRENSVISEIPGVDREKVTKDKLYGYISKALPDQRPDGALPVKAYRRIVRP